MRRTAILALAALGASPAIADVPAFVGTWASDQTCQAAEMVEFAQNAVQSDFMYCEYEGVSEVAPGQWNIASQCLYEGDRNPVQFELRVDADTMRQTTISPDGHSHDIELVRCGS